MFRIADGRDSFYQWDSNRQIIVTDPTISEVHFCNKTDDCSLVVEVYADPLDSEIKADVPNILLQNDFPIRVYAYCGDGYTKIERVFKVITRSKPSDYVYVETNMKKVLVFSDDGKGNVTLEAKGGVVNENGGTGGDIDLSDYYTKDEVDALIPDVSNFISEIPSEYITETELEQKGYITEHQSLAGYATEQYVTNSVNLAYDGLVNIMYTKTQIDNMFSNIAIAEEGSY